MLTVVCVCVSELKVETEFAAQTALEACSFQGLEVNRRPCRRPQQAEARASGFSHPKAQLESRVTIDRSEGNGDMNGADGGKLLRATVVYTQVN